MKKNLLLLINVLSISNYLFCDINELPHTSEAIKVNEKITFFVISRDPSATKITVDFIQSKLKKDDDEIIIGETFDKTRCSGTWILLMNGGETTTPNIIENIRRTIDSQKKTAVEYIIPVIQYSTKKEENSEITSSVDKNQIRLIKNKKEVGNVEAVKIKRVAIYSNLDSLTDRLINALDHKNPHVLFSCLQNDGAMDILNEHETQKYIKNKLNPHSFHQLQYKLQEYNSMELTPEQQTIMARDVAILLAGNEAQR